MPLCFIPACKNRSDNRNWKKFGAKNMNSKVTFHRFPNNGDIRKLWADILEIDSSSIPTGARICSAHFTAESFDRSSPSSVRLRPNTLPHRVHESMRISSSSTTISRGEFSVDQRRQTLEISQKIHRTTSPMRETKILIDRATSPITAISAIKSSTSKEDKETMVTPELVYNSPEKRRLRQRIDVLKKQYTKKIRALQQNLRRSTNRITTLQNTLETLKQKT